MRRKAPGRMKADDAKRAPRGARRPLLPWSLKRIAAALERAYGAPEEPISSDPLELILFENVVYLASDEKRRKAFSTLCSRVGTRPEAILAASEERLLEATSLGILPSHQALKLRAIASRAKGLDLGSIVGRGGREAVTALKAFPSLGEAGAERILLLSGAQALLALDSNGLRVLLRVGWGREDKDYTRTLRSVQDALKDQVGTDIPWLVRVHQVLRRHGQSTCRRSQPLCEGCALNRGCSFAAAGPKAETQRPGGPHLRARRARRRNAP